VLIHRSENQRVIHDTLLHTNLPEALSLREVTRLLAPAFFVIQRLLQQDPPGIILNHQNNLA
jgi:hypothetical protein